MGINWKTQEPIEHTEHTIQRQIVYQYLNQAVYMVPNMHHRFGEMDMFMLRRGSGYAEEFEIKISTSDFKADAHKVKKHQHFHNLYVNAWFDKKGYAISGVQIPNRFSYVVGRDVDVDKIRVPHYSGLFKANNYWGGLTCVKSPPLIHKTKSNWDRKVAKSTSFRYLRTLKLMGRL